MKHVITATMVLSMSLIFGFSQNAEAKKSASKPSMSYTKAKQDCLAENTALKGKALQKCIKKNIRKG
jgi:hypothetical protein